MKIRQPIISILAHVDHGKTTLLDYIRGSNVVKLEAGGITQHIGATEVPIKTINKICGDLIKKWNVELKVPGLLFIDTPGHAAFTLLRKRGGSLADIAILVIDVNEGIMPQTEEAINILKQYNTPFVVAANKIDKISGWVRYPNSSFSETFSKQNSRVQEEVDNKIYELIGQLYKQGFQTDRYDRIKDFKKQVSIIPISALTGEGIPELLTTLTGLAQRYLEKKLEIDSKGYGEGIVLEVKEVKGLGITLDVILHNGVMRKGDYLVIGDVEKPIETRIKALLKTNPLKEIRVEKQFIPVKEISAAAGMKISALNLENAKAGVPVRSSSKKSHVPLLKELVQKDIESVEIKTENEGIIIKADTLGSLEAIVKTFKDMNVAVRKAKIGVVTRKDVSELEEMDDKYRIIFAFNTLVLPEAENLAKERNVVVLQDQVIYRLSEGYEEFLENLKKKKKEDILKKITKPAKIRIMPEFIFRQSKPAIVGVDILGGTLKEEARLMNIYGEIVGEVIRIQDQGVNIKEGVIGMQVAVSIDKATVGRNVKEEDVLFTFLTKEDYQLLKKNMDVLTDNEKNVLEEVREIMVKKEKYWDVV